VGGSQNSESPQGANRLVTIIFVGSFAALLIVGVIVGAIKGSVIWGFAGAFILAIIGLLVCCVGLLVRMSGSRS
jgi:hypothetical protein